jgi:hypothetical protein
MRFGGETMGVVTKAVLVGVFLAGSMFALGCADKARPKLDECEKLEGEGKFKEAADACMAAVSADPASKSAKAAAQKLGALTSAIEKQDKEAARARAAATPPASASAPPPPPPKPMTGFCAELGLWSSSLASKHGMNCNTALDPGCTPGDNLGVVKNSVARTLKDPRVWRRDKRTAVMHVYANPLKLLLEDLTKNRTALKATKTDAEDKAIRDGLVKDYDDCIALAQKWKRAVESYNGEGAFEALNEETLKVWATYREHEAARKAACEKLAAAQ